MAITRAQQAKQMLQKGGRIGLFKGAQADTKEGKAMSPGTTASGGRRDDFRGAPPGRDVVTVSPVQNKYGDETQKRLDTIREDFINEPVTIKKIPFGFPGSGIINLGLGVLEKPLTAGQKITRKFNFDKVAKAGRYTYTDPETGETYTFDQDLALTNPEIFEAASKQLLKDRAENIVDAYGNPIRKVDDGPDEIIIPKFAQAPSTMDQIDKETLTPVQQAIADRGIARAFVAKGGRAGFRSAGAVSASYGDAAAKVGPVERPGGGRGDGPSGPPRVINPPPQTKPDPTFFDKTKALATVPLNLIGGLFGNPFDPKEPIQVINTKAQKDYLDYLANQKEDNTGVLSYDDYGTKFNLSDLKDLIAFSTAMTMGGTGFKKADTGDITYTGGTYDFDGAVPFIDSGGLMGLAYRGGEFLADKLKPAKLADGGNVVGGEYDFESARQMYGLGKLVKKVTRGIKKIAKSPIGKAALLYTGAAGLGALGAGTGFAGFKSSLFSPSTILSNLAAGGRKLGILKSQFPAFSERVGPLAGFIDKFPGGGAGAAITAVSLLPLLGIGTGDESEEEAEELLRGQGIDIAAIRANPNQYLAPRFAAEGGIMRQQYQEGSKEPVAKKTMPLLDMGGMEKDYREDGGFVPIGRMEKADDVPARLSKNEFVFTADAVRNAGDGDVDKGAEVMYNMMKNLEAGGDVSEESQGLEGAREMFQTSRRLEEVL